MSASPIIEEGQGIVFGNLDPLAKTDDEKKFDEIFSHLRNMPELQKIKEAENEDDDDEDLMQAQNSTERFTIEKAFKKIGSDKTYQRRILYTAILCLLASGMISFSINFMCADPIVECEEDGQFHECSEKIGCPQPSHRLYFRYNSWAHSYGLYCDKRSERNQGKVMVFITNAIVCLILLNCSDLLGRKKIIIVNSLLIFACLTLAVVLRPYLLRLFFIGVAFGCEGDFIPLFIFLMSENTGRL